MSDDVFHVSELETGRIRLFTVEITEAELDRIQNPQRDMPPTAAAIATLVGLDWIDAGYAEIFNIADLEGLGLANYLVQGAGVSEATISEHRALLDQVQDIVLILYSRAFEQQEVHLTLHPAVQLIEMFEEETHNVTFEPLPNKSATEPANLATPPSNAHFSVVKAVLLLPGLLIVLALLIWVLFL
ncbi:hypothetical protein NBRC116601_27900 [Cognatishimia sp. WU-CL00825]|uniref:hypothetical protein n=1 Tax=Cognatishimia sp. WU-CL00825 TaxID=3127658 RepID=UPI003101E105